MVLECERRFCFRRSFAIPSRPTTSTKFRAALAQLLWTPWDPSKEVSEEAARILQQEKMSNWQLTFAFFNGNLTDPDKWEHWCPGPHCCRDEQHSLAKARFNERGLRNVVARFVTYNLSYIYIWVILYIDKIHIIKYHIVMNHNIMSMSSAIMYHASLYPFGLLKPMGYDNFIPWLSRWIDAGA